jgi:hypothetical protein
MQHRRLVDHRTTPSVDDGFSMVATMLSMVAVALLVALLLSETLHSNGSAKAGITNAPGVAQADGLVAQQALSAALSAADTAAVAAGGYGAITPSSLSSSEPSDSFVSGPSSSPSVVSVAVSAGQGSSVPGAAPSGSITLAARASDGTCWLVWKSAVATWYGAQTDLASCTAPAITNPPLPTPVSSTAIGWQEGSFPSA